jgi:hypothetical protein
MILSLLLLSAAWFADTGRAEAEKKLLVRLHTTTEEQMERLPGWLDIAGARPFEWTDVIVREEELSGLRELGIPMEVLVEDVEAFMGDRAGQYYSFSQLEGILQGFVASYPSIAKLDTIGYGHQGNEIYLLKISDNVEIEETDEEELLFVGVHHAREWPSLNVTLFIADSLLSAYGTESEITDIVDTQQIWIIPCMNADGYIYSHDQGHDWRKNRHYFSQYGSWGVDLNRNWGGSFDGNRLGQWGSVQGSISNNPDQEVYCGPGPVSENETLAMHNFSLAHDFIFMVTYHSYGELVLWPFGYTYSGAPDQARLSSIGTQMANRITGEYGGFYTPQQSSQLYPTTGDACDHLYGRELYVGGSNTLPYTIELGASFQPPSSYLDELVRENWDAAYYLMTVADSVRALLTPRVMPPVLDPMTTDSDGNYTVSWTEANPAAAASQYELDELTGYSFVEDNAEGGSGLWTLNGFTVSTDQHHSGSHSYYSTTQSDNQTVTMKTKYPYFVESGDSLTYWCLYSIEDEWDYAFVEVSLEGKEWDLLASYTGLQTTWQRKALSLGDYVGKWIFIQFRYITDDYTVEPGFNVDDIAPVPNFSTETVLSSVITDPFFDVTGRPSGLYYYRVKGYNTARGWGDFGQYEDMEVRRGKIHKVPHKF